MTAVTMHPRIAARRIAVKTDKLQQRGRRLVGFGVLLLLVLAGALATQTRLLDVDEFEIAGVREGSQADVLAAAQAVDGQPLVGLDLGETRAAIAALPWVDSVRTSRSWSGKVTIEVDERVAVAQLSVASGWQVIDAEGRVLESQRSARPELVTLAGVPGSAVGGWLPSATLPALEIASFVPPVVADGIEGLRVDERYGAVLDVRGGGVVALGSSDSAEEKMLSVVTFFEQVDLSCLDVLDVRVPATPVLTRQPGC